jgi:hypothetical protein
MSPTIYKLILYNFGDLYSTREIEASVEHLPLKRSMLIYVHVHALPFSKHTSKTHVWFESSLTLVAYNWLIPGTGSGCLNNLKAFNNVELK